MIVYRLENCKGEGPFRGEQAAIHLLRPHAVPENLLPPKLHDWLALVYKFDYVFAWKSKPLAIHFVEPDAEGSRLARWSEMIRHGFTIQEYDTQGAHIILPDGQVIFKKEPNETDITMCRYIRDLVFSNKD